MLATPDSFRLNQSPLGAIHLPQAPTSVGHAPSPEGPFDDLGEVMLSSAVADSRVIPFVLTESQAMMWALLFCFRLANAIATWRQAKVCLRPLSSYGEDRASRPPPLQHRAPIRAASSCLRRHRCWRRSAGSLRDLCSPGQVNLPARTPSKHLISASRLPDIV